jgi:cyclopropane-fatty-acyl-phospholipid synthase
MFEAVGERYWPAYFDKISETLAPGGRAGLQIITIRDEEFENYRIRADFIQKYIFPGGMLPSERRLREETANVGLGFEVDKMFGLSYARTLAEWAKTFDAVGRRPPGLRREVPGCGVLPATARQFRTGRTDVVQLFLAKA